MTDSSSDGDPSEGTSASNMKAQSPISLAFEMISRFVSLDPRMCERISRRRIGETISRLKDMSVERVDDGGGGERTPPQPTPIWCRRRVSSRPLGIMALREGWPTRPSP